MKAVTGVFQTKAEAEQAFRELRKSGIDAERVTLLAPGSEQEVEHELQSVPKDDTEQPGMGKAIGALAGGGIGVAAGPLLLSLVPGVGPISAVGLLGAAILGAAGATVGASIGNKSENALSQGLPEDEIFVYEDALRKGRTVVVALAEDDDSAQRTRKLLTAQGAESVDAAREQWWVGLRDDEKLRYSGSGREFSQDERFYRMGFEAALHARNRCREFDQVSAEMDAALQDAQHLYPGAQIEEAFTRGYRRGREHYQQMCDQAGKAA
jgi:hypothetical protein